MYDHSLHLGRKHFCRYCSYIFNTEEILKDPTQDCIKVHDEQILKTGEYVKLKKISKKKELFMIYTDFESILVPEDNGKQNPNEFYTNKYQKPLACSNGYKLVCADNKFSKSFQSY